ncbi:MAG: hypothetical protein HFK07_01080 [Clostridia bacterium]|jgi:hypothetical protein|nr:hypothetical protein [Clostridia bacterium]
MMTFLLPTNDPDTFYRHLYPTFDVLLPIKESISFAINFQPPWTEEIADKVVLELRKKSFAVDCRFSRYTVEKRGEIPFNRIRYDCATLRPYSEVYALCDDDFEFREGADLMIREIITLFRRDSDLGVVQCYESPNLDKYYIKVEDPRKHAFFTSNGFFFRNLYANGKGDVLVYPYDALGLVGACEEFIIGLSLTERGHTLLKRTRSRIKHYRERFTLDENQRYWGTDGICFGKRGIFSYIKEKYGIDRKEVKRSESYRQTENESQRHDRHGNRGGEC